MFKDIKNVMSSKRTNSASTPHATIQDAITGTEYYISADEELIIGRSLTCAIVVEEIYISRRHCVIRYENRQFVVFDNDTSSGTFLNSEKLNGKDNPVPLKHGDLIGFGDKRKLDYVFKFNLSSNSEKRPKLDKNTSKDTVVENNLKKLHSEVLTLKLDQLILKNKFKSQIIDMQNMQKEASKLVRIFKTETMKYKCDMQELNKKVSECEKTIEVQKNCLDVHNTQQSSSLLSVESFKTQVQGILENDFQCPICNEVMVKASTANCTHTYCEVCIKKWMTKSKICPVCRSSVQNISNCLAMDNFITSLYEIIGGPIKEQRDNLQKERRIPAPPTAKRGRKKTNGPRGRARVELHRADQEFIAMQQIALDHLLHPAYRDDIEVVDLTHNMSR